LQPIAIIGASCRFPGASGLDEFWRLLREGRNAVRTVTKDRWDPEARFDPDPAARVNVATRHGGFIEGIREFDCGFFGISPREAADMDPQQRLLLETAYEAFEDAGVPMDALAGSRTAVYVGIGPGDYGRMCVQPGQEIGAHYVTGNFLSTAVDRLAYFFDLRGPTMAVDTACSSSLVSVHLACRSLACGEADLALAGGVNALLSPALSISLAKAGMLSLNGQCKAFDADADGYVRGEGAGFLALKRLDEAIADRDRIYAVIRGSAVRQGGRRNGLTAPDGWGQEAVMRAAWQESGVVPSDADYVEAQGTGTLLGDAIEGNTLGKVFGPRDGRRPCRIGSVKTNIGHLETAAGVASLVKVALMMSHGEFVPSLYADKPNPHVNFGKLGLTIQKQVEVWSTSSPSPRFAGVSSFGMGGTFAHVCLSSADHAGQQSLSGDLEPSEFVLPLSARQPEALRELVRHTARLLETANTHKLADLCRVGAVRRTHLEYRIAFAGQSGSDLSRRMDRWLQDAGNEFVKANARRKLVAVLPGGEGAQSGPDSNPAETGARPQCSCPAGVLEILEQWGVRPARIFRAMQSCTFVDALSGQSTNELEELKRAGNDFLDFTPENWLSGLDAGRGAVLACACSPEAARAVALRTAAELYQRGYPIAWRKVYPGPTRQENLPRYPWQHEVCWRESLNSERVASPKREVAKPSVAPRKGSVQAVLARVTGLPVEKILLEASPNELGIDSLMTLELQEELKREFGVLLPVETLVQVNSVWELELALQQGSKADESTSATLRSTSIRQAVLRDYEQITALLARNGLETRSREEWQHLWIDNPVYRNLQTWPMGWIVEDGAEIVGYLGMIPVSYHFKGREVLAASLHAFSLDAAHRGQGLLLLNRLQECPGAEYFVGSTANANSSKLLDRLGIERVPVGDWENSAFWIINYEGFTGSFLSRKRWPASLAGLASFALRSNDKLLRSSWPEQKHCLQRQTAFDERFDVFWQELQKSQPERFLATRSRETLDWHFKFSLSKNRTWVVTHEVHSRLVAYGIFQRQDNREVNLKKIRLIDWQCLPGAESTLGSMLGWALGECRSQGMHMLEAFGFRPDKQKRIDRLAPHRRKLSSWTYFHKLSSPALQRELQDPEVWDPSPFDGDASL